MQVGFMAAAPPVVLGAAEVVHHPTMRHKHHLVTFPLSIQDDLQYWGSLQHLSQGILLGQVTSHVTVFMDTSLTGWEGTCMGRAIDGVLPPSESRHINLLRYQALLLVLQHLKPLVQGRSVTVS